MLFWEECHKLQDWLWENIEKVLEKIAEKRGKNLLFFCGTFHTSGDQQHFSTIEDWV